MASPLNNPLVSGGLGLGILLYFAISLTPEGIKQPIRDFFTGEIKRVGGKEPELKTGTEKMFRADPQGGPRGTGQILSSSRDGEMRALFREIPKGAKEKSAVLPQVPEAAEGTGLLAVWMDGSNRAAMMTDGMVREGDRWQVFTVEEIRSDAVTLRHEGGERILRLGDIQTKKTQGSLSPRPTPTAKVEEGSAESQVQKVLDMQKSLDPMKLMQGLPKKLLDTLKGTPAAPTDTK